MSRAKTSLDHKRIRRLIWLVLTVSVLLGYSLQSVAGNVYYSNEIQNYATVSSPPVILQNGTAGTSTIYTNNTSAKVNVSAPLFDYVDNDDSDVDSSEDKGTHSNFTAQQYGPDSTYDTLTEQDTTVLSVALIVGNPGSPSATQDVPFYAHINARARWTATYLAATPLPDVSGYDLVEITYSVGTSSDFSSWKTLAKPILIHDRGHADDIALTTTEGGYQTGQTTINITDNTHYIISPYSLGNLAIASSTYFSYAGTIAGDVDALATISGYSTDWALLEIDTGETLSDGVTAAPARRVYYPPVQYDATTLNSDGWAIFDRVMGWLEPAHIDDKEENVDLISDVDYSPDKGTHSNFTAQQYGPDSIYDTLTEENVGVYSNSTLLDDGFEAVDWDANWDDISHNWLEDNSIMHTGSASAWADDGYEGYFASDNLNASGSNAIYVDFWFRKDDIEDTDFTLYYYNGSNYNLIDELDDNGGDDTWLHYTEKVTESQYFVSNFRIRFDATLADFFGDENVWVDDVLIKKEIQTGDNYELDLEVQWTNLHFGFPNEELCIYANTTDIEDIKVDVWNTTTSSWDNLLSDLNPSSWNNVSITDWLTSTTFAIRLNGGNETGDTTQDNWQIDIVLIHAWTNYILDLEVQWASVDYDEANEELCIYANITGTEDIRVDVWNVTAWQNLFTNLTSGWNNVSVSSYLATSTFTIRFKGDIETGDTTQDSWYIDATVLRVWTNVQAPTGWLSGWDKRARITIDKNDVDSPLSNFPVLVHLSNGSGRNNDDVTFVFDEVGSNSKKIAVTTSDGTQCYVEIERWDNAGEQAWLWVKVPSISNTTDTELYLYYDMGHADNTVYVGDTGSTAAQNVWDSSFKGVWHLSETSGGVGAIKDSTSNNNVGTDNGSPTFNTTGRIDSAISFDGIDDYINMSNSASLQFTSSLTIEAWINLESFGSGSDVDIVLRKGEANPNDYQLAIHDQKLALMIEENDDAGLESTANLTATTWYYLAGTWNGSIKRVYLNGSEDGSGPKPGNIIPDTRDIYIGGRSGTDLSTGVIDEVRASNMTRSAAWIKASYESERDDLLGFGSEETCGRAEEYDFVLQVANQVANNWTINLQVYDSSNLARLSKATISFHDGNSSDQITVSDGSITQPEGPPYNLAGNATVYISMSNLQATTNDTSYLYVYLKIQVPDTSTYMLYLITFEIT